MLNVTGDQDTGVDVPAAYGQKVGERLRLIRRQKRMSLQEVEASSSQEFKASVLGAYERGERAISVPRLQRLARFYNVPVDQLLPERRRPGPSPTAPRAPAHDGSVTIDLRRLERLNGAEADMLSRYLTMIQVQRQDFNGRMLTIRRDDLRAIACILGRHRRGRGRPPRRAGSQPQRLTTRQARCRSNPPERRRAGNPPERRQSGDFGVYVHVPFCARRCDYCAFATWTDRDHLIGDYLDASSSSSSAPSAAGCSQSAGDRSPRCSSAAVPRRCVPPEHLMAVLAAMTAGARRRGHRRVQPRHRDARAGSRPTAAGGVNRLSFGVQSMVAARARRPRAHPRRRAAWRRGGRCPASRVRQPATSTSSTAARASRSTTGPRTLDRVLALDPAARERLRAHRRGRDPAGRRPRSPSRRRRPGRQVPAGRRSGWSRAGLDWYEISNWARPGHECRHNQLYWRQGDYRGHRLRGPLAPPGPAVVERAHAGALPRSWCEPVSRPRAARETLRTTTRRTSRGCSWPCAPPPGYRPRPSRRAPPSSTG